MKCEKKKKEKATIAFLECCRQRRKKAEPQVERLSAEKLVLGQRAAEQAETLWDLTSANAARHASA